MPKMPKKPEMPEIYTTEKRYNVQTYNKRRRHYLWYMYIATQWQSEKEGHPLPSPKPLVRVFISPLYSTGSCYTSTDVNHLPVNNRKMDNGPCHEDTCQPRRGPRHRLLWTPSIIFSFSVLVPCYCSFLLDLGRHVGTIRPIHACSLCGLWTVAIGLFPRQKLLVVSRLSL